MWASQAGGRERTLDLPEALGTAVVVRLGLLAGIDPWEAAGGLGRMRIRSGRFSADFLVALQGQEGTLRVELSRVSDAGTAPAAEQPGAPRTIGVYRIRQQVGQGGMGIVYEAEDSRSGDTVALKVLRADVAAEHGVATQLVREGQAASRAGHEAIVGVADFGVLGDGRAFLVMEWVPHPTLDQVLADGALPWKRAVTIARRVAEALAAAHVRGVIHRDLKPSNVFLDAEDRVKIGDFGAAKVMKTGEDADAEDVAVGTPLYMAPEQIQGRPVDETSDVYALGCVLYQMLSGRPPHVASTVDATLLMHINAPVPEPASPHGRLPADLVALVRKCLAKDPAERPRSAAALGEALGKLLADSRKGPRP